MLNKKIPIIKLTGMTKIASRDKTIFSENPSKTLGTINQQI